MSKDIWGATAAEWDAFSALCLADIRPCVMNPHVYTLPTKARPTSVKAGADFSKRPSRLIEGKAAGMRGWTTLDATKEDVEAWKLSPELGCGFVGRTIKAIDIDIDDQDLADEVDAAIAEAFGTFLPSRTRPGSSRRMLLYRFDEEDSGRKKQVIRPAAGGMVEFLFDRSFFVVAGRHHSGVRQLWEEGIPESVDDLPSISVERLTALIRQLAEEFDADDMLDESVQYEFAPRAADDVDQTDPAFQFVVNSPYFRGFLPDGQLSVKCPWWREHSDRVELPENLTVTTVFPRGLGGNKDFMGFKCQHTSHGPKTGAEFLDAIGFVPPEFEILETEPSEAAMTRPQFLRVSKEGTIFFNELDLSKALEWVKGLGYDMVYDEFRSELQIRGVRGAKEPWRAFQDSDYHRLSIALIEMGFSSVNDSKLRAGVRTHGEKYCIDSAIDWASALKWDGKDRLSDFHTKVLKTHDTPYAQAVVYYMFTALAARVLDPGAKADMVPVLSGRQGTRKTTFVHALAPFEKWSCRLDLGGSDADSSRMIVGKVVAELDELRGLGTREEEGIKSWVTKTHEEWIPKFMEMTRVYKRRCLFIGTTNSKRFLQDATGERRWLPLQVCLERGAQIETEYVEDNLEQLWAQGIELYRNNGGIMWEKAEHLAQFEHEKHAVRTIEQEALSRWIHAEGKYEFTTYEAITEGMRVNAASYAAAALAHRIERALIGLGYEEEDNVWRLPFI